jgi:Protein of unknown function, DUF547
MKLVFIILFSFSLSSFGQDFNFFDACDKFMSKNVSSGQVNYPGIKAEPTELNELIKHISKNEWSKEEEKAYLINVYNLGVINKVIQNYPVNSPMDITNFFEGKDLILNGKKTSLNLLENEMLRPVYNDPRFHFVLVCGAVSCPVITNFAYTPEKLEAQLETQAKIALNNGSFVYQDRDKRNIFLSEIFKWYSTDFGKNEKEVVAYINGFREAPFSNDAKVQYYDYDWSLNTQKPITTITDVSNIKPADGGFNLQTFTAGSLLGKNKFDFTLFNTLYTETKSNWQGQDFTGFRATFVTHLFQVTYGISKSKRINVGLDINLKNSGRSVDSSIKGLAPAFQYNNTDSSRFAVTSIGARVKVQPFKKVQDFSIQSTFYLPTVQNPEGSNPLAGNPALYWADWDRYIWWNQLFYTKTWGKVQLFTEVDLLFRFKRRSSQIGMLDIPMSAFISYFPTNKITLYAMTQHVPRFTNNINPQDPQVTDWVIPMNYTASGLGMKYNFTPSFNIELLYTNFWRGKNSGLGSTFNLGIKYVMF